MTQAEKLARVLSDGQWHLTTELVQVVGHRFSATMHVAVRQGAYQIEKRRSSDRQFEYRKITSAVSQY